MSFINIFFVKSNTASNKHFRQKNYGVYFINLDSRKDRLAQTLSEFERQSIKAERIPGIIPNVSVALPKIKKGALGCTLSHIDAVSKNNYRIGVVFEDDVLFKTKFPAKEFEFPTFDWDVLMLGYNGKYDRNDCKITISGKWCRVTNMQTTSGYAFKATYVDHLLRVWNESINNLLKNKLLHISAGDMTWKQLQKKKNHLWYAAVPRVIIQRAGYSNIEHSFQNYGV